MGRKAALKPLLDASFDPSFEPTCAKAVCGGDYRN
jgi:hypothetical protein